MSPDALDSADRASAQVVGALLLVVVTLVGAVVMGIVAFDLDDRVLEEERPTVEFRFEYDPDAEALTVRHRSGRALRGDRVEFVGDGGTLASWSGEPNVTAGDEITIRGVPPDRTVTVVWYDEDGDRHELRRWSGPRA